MPVLTKLDIRLEKDEFSLYRYRKNLIKAEISLPKLPLIHLIGERNFGGLLSPIPTDPRPYCLKVSDDDDIVGKTSTRTHNAEDGLGLGRCLYFYIGRALPLMGGVAFAFDMQIMSENQSSVTPFDTGGLFHGHIHIELPDDSVDALKDFTQASISEFAYWPEAGVRYLAAYFNSLSAYWYDRPCYNDPERIFSHEGNEWRAWTLEVQFRSSQSIFSTDGWCASRGSMELYRRKIKGSLSEAARLRGLIEKSLDRNGTPDYDIEIELWARKRAEVE